VLDDLIDAVGRSTAIRSHARLKPTVPGSRILPPTFANAGEGGAGGHLYEKRVTENGTVCDAVLLDSVGSAANRAEEALLQEVRAGRLAMPDLIIKVGDFGSLSTLEMPHRCFDAYLWESEIDGTPFPQSQIGLALQGSNLGDATALYRHAPMSLVCGAWNSHGASGGHGSKFARVLSAEVVGLGVERGVRAAQKTDPFIEKPGEVIVYESEDDSRFTTDPERAKKDRGRPKQKKASELGFGAVPATQIGGVSLEHAEQHVVLSLGQLRRLQFPMAGEKSAERDRAGRAVLASLGMLAIELQRDRGFSLRSGCELTLENEPSWEIVGRTLQDVRRLEVAGSEDARRLFDGAVEHARSKGLEFAEPVHLEARADLVEIVKAARSLG
jgi:CRISPR-associated protein Csb1